MPTVAMELVLSPMYQASGSFDHEQPTKSRAAHQVITRHSDNIILKVATYAH